MDVAKATLQVHSKAINPNQKCAKDHAQTVQETQSDAGAHVICEATGGYERALVKHCTQAHILVSVSIPLMLAPLLKPKENAPKPTH